MSTPVFTSLLAAALLVASTGCRGDDADSTTSSATSTRVATTTSTTTTAAGDRNPPVTTPPEVSAVETTGKPDRSTPSTSGAGTAGDTTSTSTPALDGVLMPPPTNPPPDEPVVPADEQGATDLASDPFCDPSSLDIPAIALSWVPEGTAEQLLALSTLPDGFDTDRYTVTDVLAPDASDASISPVEPGGIYYWRILSRSPGGWIASEIASFSGPTCVLDRPSSP